jgi:hypothetical protein
LPQLVLFRSEVICHCWERECLECQMQSWIRACEDEIWVRNAANEDGSWWVNALNTRLAIGLDLIDMKSYERKWGIWLSCPAFANKPHWILNSASWTAKGS